MTTFIPDPIDWQARAKLALSLLTKRRNETPEQIAESIRRALEGITVKDHPETALPQVGRGETS